MANDDIFVDGLRELEIELQELAPKIAKGVLRKAMREGGKIFLNEVKARTPVQTQGPLPRDASGNVRQPGSLRRSMGMKVSVKRGTPSVAVGSMKKFAVAHIVRFLERGTGAGLSRRSGKSSKRSRRFAARHRGIKALHFMEQAFDAKHGEVLSTVQSALKRFLDSYRAKLP